jgi:hypothetical protein
MGGPREPKISSVMSLPFLQHHLLAFRFSWLGARIFVRLFCGMLKIEKMG